MGVKLRINTQMTLKLVFITFRLEQDTANPPQLYLVKFLLLYKSGSMWAGTKFVGKGNSWKITLEHLKGFLYGTVTVE